MYKYLGIVAAIVVLALAVPGKPVASSGSWLVDSHHSAAQLSTDGTTNFGKTKMDFTVGFARMNGTVQIDSNDLSKSAFDFRFYPSTAMEPAIGEDGKTKIEWFSNLANNTLVCFHSKGAQQAADGKLRTTGDLIVTRVDRNVEASASEAYAGPVYGPPILHRVTHQATFSFDPPAAAGGHDGAAQISGSTSLFREDFPPLLKTVLSTAWPAVIFDRNCKSQGAVSEAYAGTECTGTFLSGPVLPPAPQNNGAEDYPGPQNFNSVTGNKLTVVVRMRLIPAGSSTKASGGN